MKTRLIPAAGCTLLLFAGLAHAGSPKAPAFNSDSFHVKAKLSVGDHMISLPNGVAIRQMRRGAPGYSWLRIYLYSFPLDAQDIAGARKGDVTSMERKWHEKSSNPDDYNNSHGVVQLTVDKNFKVWQVDMSVPGHSCTIAPFPKDVQAFLQSYRFDGRNLKLTSKGSYVCGKQAANVPEQTLGWDINMDIPVFQKK
jgi:hypothetical protein